MQYPQHSEADTRSASVPRDGPTGHSEIYLGATLAGAIVQHGAQ
jgi:hypothetical protein